MKILYICEEYPPGRSGGIGTMVQNLSREAVRQGHQVWVVGLYPHGYGHADYEEDNGVKIFRLRYKTDIGFITNELNYRNKALLRILKYTGVLHADTLISTKKLFQFIARLIDEFKIDVVEMQDWNTFFQNAFTTIAIPEFNTPLVVKFNGSYSYFAAEMGQPLKRVVYKSEKSLFLRAQALSAVSKYTAEKTANLFNLKRPIEILYNCINLPQVPMVNKTNDTVVFTGTLMQKKGIYSLLKAWNRVIEKYPSARLKVFGKGNYKELQKLLSSTALHAVDFYGHVDRHVLFLELSKATMAVFPSYSECFALAPLEAMAVGCAVINTSRSSGKELVEDKENGLLIDPDDIEGIANAIITLLTNPELQNKIGAKGKQLVQNKFGITNSVKAHIDFYMKVAKAYKQSQ